ncbi:hypothetical protein HanRHA438_Chr09g0416261 [Helianthus annuus]|uniref:Uncharacterized protein n=1 Tax=Helianthus annuus TaxID=4232 RepID=A0A251U1D5_HELAN|nr:hypothetical protein HanXRQr2_Chr09g0404231 [Helianthus annuus]KAJ0535908.1 hypothetical protein HanIR_Chr09g0435701 [Helianthus annuus]KAJ0712614.1 hypothetical protein HanOQP8_Chr09g0336721 [Helianthus annuus]KAJ0889754.1 hypothetical protein HanRHA438_Chr09g0416261 [Helianthus annuus]KAJ0894539.1 hypothetical protein HanPSC8_Chr09g0390151 [Helianthus annuus]
MYGILFFLYVFFCYVMLYPKSSLYGCFNKLIELEKPNFYAKEIDFLYFSQ